MAATEAAAVGEPPAPGRRWGPVVLAALALPGAAPAQNEPGPGLISFKWLSYQDAQPGLERIRVEAPALALHLPLGSRWALDAGATVDRVSGASPRWHSAVSSASRMDDRRQAGDLKITRYGERHAAWAGIAQSDENDFHSRALSAGARWTSDDGNRSVDAALALTRDRIGSVDDPSLDERRRTVEATLGVTQAWTRADLVQATLTVARGEGFYDDPYKRIDRRPRERTQQITTLRWNHHFEGPALTLRSSWRHYRDSFGVRAHTLAFEPVLGVGERLVITPSLRLYRQSAASFYYDPVYSFAGAPLPPGYLESSPRFLSPDQRLAAFGAVTLGLKLALRLDERWSADLKLERYEQRAAWRVGGTGSPGLAPFSARFVTWGLSRSF